MSMPLAIPYPHELIDSKQINTWDVVAEVLLGQSDMIVFVFKCAGNNILHIGECVLILVAL